MDIELLESLGKTISQTALCGLIICAQTGKHNQILRDEYRRTPGQRAARHVWPALAGHVIEVEKCRGCGLGVGMSSRRYSPHRARSCG